MMSHNLILTLAYQFILHEHLHEGKNARRATKLYNHLIYKNKGNAIIKTQTNGQKFYCNFSHRLPFYQKEFPLYDKQLSKLCHHLHKELKRTINIVDVGANVGDTVLNIGLKDAFYLCIEGNESFAKLIQYNLKHRYNYSLETCYLTDNPAEKSYRPKTTNGTNRLVHSDNNSCDEGVFTQTLDQLIDAKYKNLNFDLIKIDTDGFDFKVIRGAKKCLERWQPLLFFEWDKAYCKEQGENPLLIFPILDDLGYSDCILFDNFGNPFALVPINDLKKLGDYIEKTIGAGLPYYYDVLAINKNSTFNASQLFKLFKNC